MAEVSRGQPWITKATLLAGETRLGFLAFIESSYPKHLLEMSPDAKEARSPTKCPAIAPWRHSAPDLAGIGLGMRMSLHLGAAQRKQDSIWHSSS